MAGEVIVEYGGNQYRAFYEFNEGILTVSSANKKKSRQILGFVHPQILARVILREMIQEGDL